MDDALRHFGDVLDEVAELAAIWDAPLGMRSTAWLIGKTQVAQLQLVGLEERLVAAQADRVNDTPRPGVPKHEPKNDPPPDPKNDPPPPPPDQGGDT